MIRLVFLKHRKPGTDLSAFSDYWREAHGPLVAAHQAHLDVLRYTQAHREPTADAFDAGVRSARGGMQEPFDGATEMWWASEDALAAALATRAGQRALEAIVDDERSFVDLSSSVLWLAHEYPQVGVVRDRPLAGPRTGVLRTVFPLRAKPELTLAEAQHYWRTAHGPLVRSHAVARGVICYQQVHRFDSALGDRLRAARGIAPDTYIGLAEAWFDRLVARIGPEVDTAAAAALADEHQFIDLDRSTYWSSKELLFVDRPWAL